MKLLRSLFRRVFMNSFLGLENPEIAEPQASPDRHPPPSLLVELEPWGRTFRRNLTDTLLRRRPPALHISSRPAPFWPDVFVPRRLPWGAFAESILYHLIVFAAAWGISTLLPPSPHVVQVRRFDSVGRDLLLALGILCHLSIRGDRMQPSRSRGTRSSRDSRSSRCLRNPTTVIRRSSRLPTSRSIMMWRRPTLWRGEIIPYRYPALRSNERA